MEKIKIKITTLAWEDDNLLPYLGKKVKIIEHTGLHNNDRYKYNENILNKIVDFTLSNVDDNLHKSVIFNDNGKKFELLYGYVLEIQNLSPGDYIYVSNYYENCLSINKRIFVAYNPFGEGVICVKLDCENSLNQQYDLCTWKYYKEIEWTPIEHDFADNKFVIHNNHITINDKKLDFEFIHTLEKNCLKAEQFLKNN